MGGLLPLQAGVTCIHLKPASDFVSLIFSGLGLNKRQDFLWPWSWGSEKSRKSRLERVNLDQNHQCSALNALNDFVWGGGSSLWFPHEESMSLGCDVLYEIYVFLYDGAVSLSCGAGKHK